MTIPRGADTVVIMGDGETARRVIESPCEWCGVAIRHQQRGGRRRRYCSDGHRQRAYEVRTAARRHGEDLTAGRIAETRVRVVQEVIQPEAPTRIDIWESALDALADQIETGAMPPPVHSRIRARLGRVQGALDRSRRRRLSPAILLPKPVTHGDAGCHATCAPGGARYSKTLWLWRARRQAMEAALFESCHEGHDGRCFRRGP